MKRILILAAAAAVLVGFLGKTWSQNAATKKVPQSVPHKIGLIDMARVFKEYEKFELLRTDLKSDIRGSDQQAKAMALQIQQIGEELKSKTFKQGSPEYIDREKRLTEQTSQFEAFRKNAQRDFLRKEAQIYRTIYLEVIDVVRQAAEAWNYTLVVRFNGENLDAADPQKLIQGLNRQVVYHRTDDDITDSVLDYLNRRHQREATKSSPPRTGQSPSRKPRTN